MPEPKDTTVVILGTGFAGLHAAFALRQALPDLGITVVSASRTFTYGPDCVYVPFGLDPSTLETPIEEPLARRRIDFRAEAAIRLDAVQRLVWTASGAIPYDYLLIATGGRRCGESSPGLADHGRNITSVAALLGLRRDFQQVLSDVMVGHHRDVVLVAPPGNVFPGPLYEMALLLDTWLECQDFRHRVDITVATAEAIPLEVLGSDVSVPLLETLRKRDIRVRGSFFVQAVRDGVVLDLRHGDSLRYDVLAWHPALQGPPPLGGVQCDEAGFVQTHSATRRAVGNSHVFVAGDAAGDHPIKQAFAAFSQADVAVHHILCDITGAVPNRFYEPRSRYIIDGRDSAIYIDSRLGAMPGHVSSSRLWHVSKQLLGVYLPWKVRRGEPFANLFDRLPARADAVMAGPVEKRETAARRSVTR